MTGTGIVPGDDFSPARGDAIRIDIEGIGTLENHVAQTLPSRRAASCGPVCRSPVA